MNVTSYTSALLKKLENYNSHFYNIHSSTQPCTKQVTTVVGYVFHAHWVGDTNILTCTAQQWRSKGGQVGARINTLYSAI